MRPTRGWRVGALVWVTVSSIGLGCVGPRDASSLGRDAPEMDPLSDDAEHWLPITEAVRIATMELQSRNWNWRIEAVERNKMDSGWLIFVRDTRRVHLGNPHGWITVSDTRDVGYRPGF